MRVWSAARDGRETTKGARLISPLRIAVRADVRDRPDLCAPPLGRRSHRHSPASQGSLRSQLTAATTSGNQQCNEIVGGLGQKGSRGNFKFQISDFKLNGQKQKAKS